MLSKINSDILGPLLIFILSGGGIYLLIYLRFKPFLKFGSLFKKMSNSKGAFKALCLSLSGTLGVGNIAGVASAIVIGGPGTIFWMWIFGILAMIIKYAEVVLSMHYSDGKGGGAASYIKNGLKSKKGAFLFSVLVIISSIGVGNTIQSSAAAESMLACFGTPKIITGILFAVLTLLLISGGVKRVENFSALIIPLLSLGYVIISLCIIIVNHSLLPSILKMIFSEAFSFKAIGGGTGGYLIIRSMRLGAARGILSNEAGCGTASYAHCNSKAAPAVQGMFGIIEVFVDTILLCSLTAFVVLITMPVTSDEGGMITAINSYSYFNNSGGEFIGISAAIYALASVVCWSYYGVSAIKYIGGKRKACVLYVLIYSAAGILGSVFSPSLTWEISDITISLLAVFNTICILKLSKKVKEVTDKII